MTVRPLDVIYELERRAESVGTELNNLDTSKVQFAALLDDIRSLWNVGSIFRTADGAGFDRLFLCGITATPPRKEIAKTSLGAEDHVEWNYFPSAADLLPLLRQQGLLVVGLEFVEGSGILGDTESIALADALARDRITRPLCLCVGNEVAGLSAETLSQCDLICHLPMRGFKESLNVAVAFGIAAYMIAEDLGD